MNHENIVELLNLTSFLRTQEWLVWLLYFLLTRIFLQLVVLEKEYRKQNWGMNIVKAVDNVVENLTRRR